GEATAHDDDPGVRAHGPKVPGRGPGGTLVHLNSRRRPTTRTGPKRIDKGVRGFDLEDRGGRSEPTSPDRRERAGKNQYTPITKWQWLPERSGCPPASDSSFVRARRHPGWLTDR